MEMSLNPSKYKPLLGGTAVWLFMTLEVVTFGLFLLVHAWTWRSEPAAFAESQSHLHVVSAVRGTAMLLCGSLFAYLGALAHTAQRNEAARRWLVAAALAGALFTVNKILEYASPEMAGITLSTNAFWFSYIFLTVMHLLHVIGGVVVFIWFAAAIKKPDPPVDTAAVYWHFVDLIWILLFPILYLMHP